MPFITEVVILTSDSQLDLMKSTLSQAPLNIKLLSESEIGITELPDDHQERNTHLRRKLYGCEFIDPNFIALDDDTLIIQPTALTDFFRDGQHIAHYFFDNGNDWLGAFPKPTSFDVGIWHTVNYLSSCGYDVKLYNSHQPQIINKHLALQIFSRLRNLKCDEWSSYFNIAKHLKPDCIQDTPYRAAGWPQTLSSWLPTVTPDNILFYNDFDPNESIKEAITSANKWQCELLAARHVESQILPTLPQLHISQNGAFFTLTKISCPPRVKLKLPILSSISLRKLKYRFIDNVCEYSNTSIPNFIHVPLDNLNISSSFELIVEILTGDDELSFQSTLHVQIS